MTPIQPRLLLSAKVSLPPESVPPGWQVQPFSFPGRLERPAPAAVLMLTPGEAQALLAEGREGCEIVLWSDDASQLPRAILEHPCVAGVLDARCRRETIEGVLRAAWQLIEGRVDRRAAQRLERVLEIGRALASEKDLDTLLALILTHARHLTHADGASIYTREGNGQLYFRLWQNASNPVGAEAQATPVGESADAPNLMAGRTSEASRDTGSARGPRTRVPDVPPMTSPIGDDSIAGYVARTGATVVLDDAYAIAPDAPYRFNPAVDRSTGYRTKSLLTVALKNKADDVVGVLQLINRKDRPDRSLKEPEDFGRHVLPFDAEDRALAAALAGQAGVALENSILYADIERLFEGFIRASVQAIEARDPTTAGHSFRVADFTERLAIAVDRSDRHDLREVSFTREQLRELRYAALLHDFGKVGVREHVLVKAKKLHPHQLELLKSRFRYARASVERRAWRELLSLQERGGSRRERERIRRGLDEELKRLDAFLDIVLRANEPTVSHRPVSGELEAVANHGFPGEDGEWLPLLTEFEFADLTLAKGSLNPEERTQIESHVSHTYAFLSLIPWTRDLGQLPLIAFAHHEKLDGSGYPRRLTRDQIPVQSRMMAISDIYDALTAGDRPYKRGLPEEKALEILDTEARAGKIDADLFRVFVEAGAWRLRR